MTEEEDFNLDGSSVLSGVGLAILIWIAVALFAMAIYSWSGFDKPVATQYKEKIK